MGCDGAVVGTGVGHGDITCVLQAQLFSLVIF